jgi:hypothetical protein
MEEKSVDELRTLNNQKSSAADAGPRRTGDEQYQEGDIGIVEKRGDRHFELGSDRFHDHRRPEEPDRPVRARGATCLARQLG